jgi:hypothetical protein
MSQILDSTNEGILKELNIAQLEERVELSPLGVLDLLVRSDFTFPGKVEIGCTCEGSNES